MQIVNPLYDKAFKYLMQNNRIAKKVLSVLLGQKVLKLSLSQQETVVPDEKRQFTLFRLDFKADIQTNTGEKQTVLIELQKSKFDTDIRRFRNYLGANYMNISKQEDDKNSSEEAIYPIITIYILGYDLADVPYMAVTVNRHIIDTITNKPLQINSFFINHLTHRSHILQVKRLPDERKTKLEKFMVLFNQAWCTDKRYIIDLQDIADEFKDIAQHLQKPVMDAEFRRQLEAEEEIDAIFERQETKYLKKIEEAKKAKKEAELREVEANAREKEAQAREKDAQAREKEASQSLKIVIKALRKSGKTISEIAAMLKKTEKEIEMILAQ